MQFQQITQTKSASENRQHRAALVKQQQRRQRLLGLWSPWWNQQAGPPAGFLVCTIHCRIFRQNSSFYSGYLEQKGASACLYPVWGSAGSIFLHVHFYTHFLWFFKTTTFFFLKMEEILAIWVRGTSVILRSSVTSTLSSYNKCSKPLKLKQMAPHGRPNSLKCWQMYDCAVQQSMGPLRPCSIPTFTGKKWLWFFCYPLKRHKSRV